MSTTLYVILITICVAFVVTPMVLVGFVVFGKKTPPPASGGHGTPPPATGAHSAPTTPTPSTPHASGGKLASVGHWFSHNGKLLGALAVAGFFLATVYHFWPTEWERFFKDHGWYAWIFMIATVILFVRLFGRTSSHANTPTAGGGHGGGHGHGPGTLAWLGIAIAVIIGIKAALSLFVLTWDMYQRRNEDQLGPRATMDGQRKTQFFVTAQPDGEVPITVYNGWQCEISLSSTNDAVWVHYPNAEPVLLKKGEKPTYRRYYGPYQIGLRSGLDRPVVVEVKLTPVVRK